jgi:hypothetical protein
LALEAGTETQFRERVARSCQQEGIQEFELGVSPLDEAEAIDPLPELPEFVKVLFGRNMVLHTIRFLPTGGWCNSLAALCLKSSSKLKAVASDDNLARAV